MDNNFSLEDKATSSKEALNILKKTISEIKNLNSFTSDPNLLCMSARNIADSLSKKINFQEFTNPSNSESNDFL